ncbi:MAG TPA: universal stress protein [Kribbella sp.]|nr:universal stress protein [Kribbella sp.]
MSARSRGTTVGGAFAELGNVKGYPTPQPLLVGVDSSPESQIALRWAVAAAQLRGRDVRVLRAYDLAPDDPTPVGDLRAELDAAVAFARDRLGRGRASGVLVPGRPADVLLSDAVDAEMVVVGSRHRTTTAAALLGSVTTTLPPAAPCPVVVVRSGAEPSPDGRVVVGIDGSPTSEDAIAFAFEEAAGRNVPLGVVHCWQQFGEVEPQCWSDDAARGAQDEHNAWMQASIEPYRDKYPKVQVDAQLIEDRPTHALVRLSRQADLLVVGSRGRGGFTGLLLGSVSQKVLRQARCTVAVVRPGRSRR